MALVMTMDIDYFAIKDTKTHIMGNGSLLVAGSWFHMRRFRASMLLTTHTTRRWPTVMDHWAILRLPT